MKAMVLAAGHGTRLRPLTATMSKAMVVVGGKPLLEWQLLRLRDSGIREVVVNLGPHADAVERHFGDGERLGLRIQWSREVALEAGRLGTGGGIAQALRTALLPPKPFLLCNADVWTEFPYSELLAAGLPTERLAQLVLVEPPWGTRPTDFQLGEDGLVRGTPQGVAAGGNSLLYAGIALLSPALLAGEGAVRFALREPLQRAVRRGLVGGQHYRGLWCDVGTPERLAWLRERVEA